MAILKCEKCLENIDTNAEGTYQYVAGWVRNRSGGGGHGISLPERFPRWAHPWCIDSAIKGFTNQKSMFG